jgi:2-keto-3-deoxy-L-rhamnonate aldolase RhmA
MAQLDTIGSTVFLMVETLECIEHIEQIAAVPGVDVLLIGANDLSLELGIQGQWDNPLFRNMLNKVASACRSSGKVFGIAGLYNRPDLCKHAIKELGARYILGNLDIGLISSAAKTNVTALRLLEENN